MEMSKKVSVKKTDLKAMLISLFAFLLRSYRWNYYDVAFFDGGIHSFFALISAHDFVLSTIYKPPIYFEILGFIYNITHDALSFKMFDIILSSLCVYLLYVWVKKEYNKKIALLSAFFLAINPVHIMQSHYVNPDTLAMFFALILLILINKMASSKNKKYSILGGIVFGLLFFIRHTVFIFYIYSFIYMWVKKISKGKLYYFFVFAATVIFIYSVPLIMVQIMDPSHPLALFNYFATYEREQGGATTFGMNVDHSWNMILSSLLYIGPIFIFAFITNYRKLEKKYLFLYIWIIVSFTILSLISRYTYRYFAIQTFTILPILILGSRFLSTLPKNVFYALFLLAVSFNIYYYYQYHFGNVPELNFFNYLSMDSSRFMKEFIVSHPGFVLTNVPYAFLKDGLLVFSANYEPHLRCPNSKISYMLLLNSSRNPKAFPSDLLSKYGSNFKLEQVYKSDVDEVYVYSVNTTRSYCELLNPFITLNRLVLTVGYLVDGRVNSNIFINARIQ